MNRRLLAAALLAVTTTGSALAADLPIAPYPAHRYQPPPIAYSWSGCYFGVEGGGSLGHSDQVGARLGDSITNNFGVSGGLAGGTAGCNYQFGHVVVGVEDDMSWTNVKGSANDLAPFIAGAVSTTSEKWIDTLRARIGLGWDRLFFYGTGGAAFADASVKVCTPLALCDSQSQIRTGWVAGGGVEWAAWVSPLSSVTLKLEYLHADYGTGQFFSPPVPIGTGLIVSRNVSLTNDMVRAGLNWKFNWFELPGFNPGY